MGADQAEEVIGLAEFRAAQSRSQMLLGNRPLVLWHRGGHSTRGRRV